MVLVTAMADTTAITNFNKVASVKPEILINNRNSNVTICELENSAPEKFESIGESITVVSRVTRKVANSLEQLPKGQQGLYVVRVKVF